MSGKRYWKRTHVLSSPPQTLLSVQGLSLLFPFNYVAPTGQQHVLDGDKWSRGTPNPLFNREQGTGAETR